MSHVQGFLAAVPKANKQAYIDMARAASALFREYGAIRMVEAWADDPPKGEVTDFRRAVKAEAGEAVVFSWIEWPDKETCDAAAARMESDVRWEEMGEMPFDGKRMIWAGFEPIFEAGG